MKKLTSNYFNMAFVLTLICLLAAVLLSFFYNLTEAPIQQANLKKQQAAILEVLPFENMKIKQEKVLVGEDSLTIYKADVDGKYVGTAVESYSKKGFNGDIKIMVGFDKDGYILNYSVLEQKETPGLGTRMIEWFRPAKTSTKSLFERIFGFKVNSVERQSSIIGLSSEKTLTVKKDGGNIDAITAATISSRAFLEAVNRASMAFLNKSNVDALTSASAMQNSSDWFSDTLSVELEVKDSSEQMLPLQSENEKTTVVKKTNKEKKDTLIQSRRAISKDTLNNEKKVTVKASKKDSLIQKDTVDSQLSVVVKDTVSIPEFIEPVENKPSTDTISSVESEKKKGGNNE